jgi:hypothetical protein
VTRFTAKHPILTLLTLDVVAAVAVLIAIPPLAWAFKSLGFLLKPLASWWRHWLHQARQRLQDRRERQPYPV